MSDIYCRHCREPWDLDSLHELVDTFKFDGPLTVRHANGQLEHGVKVAKFAVALSLFRADGCGAFWSWGTECNTQGYADDTVAMLTDLAGDDVDGLVSDLADYLGV